MAKLAARTASNRLERLDDALRSTLTPRVRRLSSALRRQVRRLWPRPDPAGEGFETDVPPTIFARAKPAKATITENYRYVQQISVNPTIGTDPTERATGTIEMVVPYDGERFFTRDAADDIEVQTQGIDNDDQEVGRDLSAVIGHLVLANAGDATLVGGGRLAAAHGAVPLTLPIRKAGFDRSDRLSADRHEAHLKIDYRPPGLGDLPFPLKVEATVFDPDDSPLTPASYRAPTPKKARKKSAEISTGPVHQVAFSSELELSFVVHLFWPRRSTKEPKARITRVSLRWPTITSLTKNFLRFQLGSSPVDVQYNPISSSLEWKNLPIGSSTDDSADEDGKESDDSTGAVDAAPATAGTGSRRRPDRSEGRAGRGDRQDDTEEQDTEDVTEDSDDSSSESRTWSQRSAQITLFVKQPGQLRNEETLHGEIEVEIEDELLSGIDARLFDACGVRHKKGTLSIKTRLVVAFTVFLADEFDRRRITATHTIQFDEIVPAPSRIDDIMSALRDQGFDVETRVTDYTVSDRPRWVLYASRSEGINIIEMLLVVDGRHHRTRRRAETPSHRYTSKMESGELRITVHGQVLRSSRELTLEINKLRESLGERFRHVRAER